MLGTKGMVQKAALRLRDPAGSLWPRGQVFYHPCTVLVLRISHRIWKENKQQPGTAGSGNMLGCCLVFFPFLWAILWPHPVYCKEELRRTSACLGHARFFSCKEINSQHLYPFKVHLFFFTGNTIQMQSKENIILISSENWVGIFL